MARASPATARQAGGVSRPIHLPAPLAGLNTRDPLDVMNPRFAVQMENLFPTQGQLMLRRGMIRLGTMVSSSAAFRTLFSYDAPNPANSKLFASHDVLGIWDVTPGTFVQSYGFSNGGLGRGINFVNSIGDSFAWFANMIDPPAFYNGTTWTLAVLTGTTHPEDLYNPWVLHHRIWCVKKNSQDAFYLALDSIQGAVIAFPMGALLTGGGYLVDGVAWTIDGGEGPDDFMAVCSSNGQVIIFQGFDPSNSASWSLRGVFYIGRPIGVHPFVKVGGDVYYLSEAGLYPLSKALVSAQINDRDAISAKISPTLTMLLALYPPASYPHWDLCVVPNRNALILSVNKGWLGGANQSEQYVLNTLTGAWCRFTGWDMCDFHVFNGALYGCTGDGNNATVYELWNDSQYSDTDPSNSVITITARLQTAYLNFNTPGQVKQLEIFRMNFEYQTTVGFPAIIQWGGGVNLASLLTTTNQKILAAATTELTQSTHWRTIALKPFNSMSLLFRWDIVGKMNLTSIDLLGVTGGLL